eukprot:GEMP01041185.1.p1 GENE.GEMP01041185.1~~GEMP01041185.1.p1  ORF type:complete len:381 (+),score=40.66 GEMP01041185.1:136-1143(+)
MDVKGDQPAETLRTLIKKSASPPTIPTETPFRVELYKVMKIEDDPYVFTAIRQTSNTKYMLKRSLLDIGIIALWAGFCAVVSLTQPSSSLYLLPYIIVLSGTVAVVFMFSRRMLELRTVVLDVLDDLQEEDTILKMKRKGLDLKMQLWNVLKISGHEDDLTYDEVNSVAELRTAASLSHDRLVEIMDSADFPNKLFNFVPLCFETETKFSICFVYVPLVLMVGINVLPLVVLSDQWAELLVALCVAIVVFELAFCWFIMTPGFARGMCNLGLKLTDYRLNGFTSKHLQPIWREQVVANHGTVRIRQSLTFIMENPNRGNIANKMSAKILATCCIQ